MKPQQQGGEAEAQQRDDYCFIAAWLWSHSLMSSRSRHSNGRVRRLDAMRAGIVVNVTQDDRRRLKAIIRDRNAPQKHIWRAKIISPIQRDMLDLIIQDQGGLQSRHWSNSRPESH